MSKPASIPKVDYAFSPIYHGISTRFRTRHGIDISAHIESMSWLGQRVEQGFNFVPWDAAKLTIALGRAGFQNDLRERHLGFIPSVGAVAALATHGQGYREKGSPSLHCAIAPDICNVHLDNVGFRMDGYGPDAGQHTVDELLWQDKVVPALGKLLPTPVTDLLHRFHPVIPNTRQIKPFSERHHLRCVAQAGRQIGRGGQQGDGEVQGGRYVTRILAASPAMKSMPHVPAA